MGRRRFRSGKSREKWMDVLPKYQTHIFHMQPILRETRRIIIDLDPIIFLEPELEILDQIRQEEEKRNIRTVRALSEFSAMYRSKIYEIMKNFITNFRGKIEPIDLKDYIVDHLYEAIKALDILQKITNPDERDLDKTYLYLLVKFIEEIIFPRGINLENIYDKLLTQAKVFYECQRHLLQTHTFYREKLKDPEYFTIPGISPKVYQIINTITSLFNLEPNYGEFPERSNYEIPMLLKNDVFESYIESTANAEEEAVENIAERIGLRVLDDIFLAPQAEFVEILLKHSFLREVAQEDGKIRYVPQFSNETLVLYYSALASLRRGFLSKELVNWIAMNFALVMYMGILKWKLSDDNIFYGIFKDLQTSEKILPYLMKLSSFPNYLGMEKMKIRDSVQYRKEIFNFIGSQIDNLKELIDEVSKYCDKI